MAISIERTIALPGATLPAGYSLRWAAKGPDDVLDYSLDVGLWLEDVGDTIAHVSAVVSPASAALNALAAAAATFSGSVVTTILSGGVLAADYSVSIRVDTVGGRAMTWPVWLLVANQSVSSAAGGTAVGARGPRGYGFLISPVSPPSPALGQDGDSCVVQPTGEVWQRISGAWADTGEAAVTRSTLRSQVADQVIPADIGAAEWVALASVQAQLPAAIGVSVVDFGAVGDGVHDDSPAFNACYNALRAAGGGMMQVPKPVVSYRMAGPLIIGTGYQGVRIVAHPAARIFMDYTPGSTGGLLQNSDITGAANGTTRPRGLTIVGGNWGVPYTAGSDLSATATTQAGNLFNLICDDLTLHSVRCEGLGISGRFFIGGGNRVLITQSWFGYSMKSTGCGGIRWGLGGPLVVRDTFCLCGDDAFQVVPASTGPTSNIDVGDVSFLNCWGGSWQARCCVVGVGDRTQGPFLATATRAGNVATFTVVDKFGDPLAHGLTVGKVANVSGVLDDSFNGNAPVTAVPSSTSFSVANIGANASSTGGSLVSGLTTAINSVTFQGIVGFGTGRAMNIGNTDSAGLVNLVRVRDCRLWNNDTSYTSTLTALCLISGSDSVISARNGQPGIGKVVVENTTISGSKVRAIETVGDVGDLIFRDVDFGPPAQPDQLGVMYLRQARSVTFERGSITPGPGQAALWLGQTTATAVQRFDINGLVVKGVAANTDGVTVHTVIRATNVGGGIIRGRTRAEMDSTGRAQFLSVINATSSIFVASAEVTGTPNATAIYDGTGQVSYGADLIPASMMAASPGWQNAYTTDTALAWDGKAKLVRVSGTTAATWTNITAPAAPASTVEFTVEVLQSGGSVTFNAATVGNGGNINFGGALVLTQYQTATFMWSVVNQGWVLKARGVADSNSAGYQNVAASGTGVAWDGLAKLVRVTGTTAATWLRIDGPTVPTTVVELSFLIVQAGGSITFTPGTGGNGGNLTMAAGLTITQSQMATFQWNPVSVAWALKSHT